MITFIQVILTAKKIYDLCFFSHTVSVTLTVTPYRYSNSRQTRPLYPVTSTVSVTLSVTVTVGEQGTLQTVIGTMQFKRNTDHTRSLLAQCDHTFDYFSMLLFHQASLLSIN